MKKTLCRMILVVGGLVAFLVSTWYVEAGRKYIIWLDICNYNAAVSEWVPSFPLRPAPLSDHVVLESAPDRVEARNSETGKQIWTSPLTSRDSGWYGQAVVGPDHSVYVSSIDPDIYNHPVKSSGRLFALDGATGTVRWIKDSCSSTYLAADDAHVFAGYTKLLALSSKTGRTCWNVSPPKPNKDMYPHSQKDYGRIVDIAYAGGLVYTTFSWPYLELCAFDSATGKLKWHADIDEDPFVDPASIHVGNGLLLIACGQCVRAFDSQTGVQKWKFDLNQAGEYSAVVGSLGHVFVSDTEVGMVYSLDAGSGMIKWTRPLKEHVNTVSASDPEGVLYVGTRGNRLYALNSATGSIKWAMPLASFPNNLIGRTYFKVAAGAQGFVYAECADESIYAVHRP